MVATPKIVQMSLFNFYLYLKNGNIVKVADNVNYTIIIYELNN